MRDNHVRKADTFMRGCRSYWFIGVLLLIILVRLYCARQMPVYAIAYSMYDDMLQTETAWSILQGNWLGTYSSLTLAKGITFPLFLCTGYLSGISYPVLLCLCNILAAFYLCVSLRPLIRNKWVLAVMFLFLIWNPVTFSTATAQRIYRNSLTFSLVLSVLAGFIGIYLRCTEKPSAVWYVLTGISLFFFDNLREDSIWLYPFVGAAVLLIFVRVLIHYRGQFRKGVRNLLLLLPLFGILLLGNLTISLLNYKAYGVFTRNDRTGTAFNEVAKDFLKAEVETPYDSHVIPVGRDQFEAVIAESPSLLSIHDNLMDQYDLKAGAWNAEGQCAGDFYIWALRSGAESSGIYSTAAKADAFWTQVSAELDSAYAEGRLTKKDGILLASSVPVFRLSDLPELLRMTCKEFIGSLNYHDANAVSSASSEGDAYTLRKMEVMTGSFIHYSYSAMEDQDDPVICIENYMIRIFAIFSKIYSMLYYPVLALLILCLPGSVILGIRLRRRKEPAASEFGISLILAVGILLTAFLGQMTVCWFSQFMGNDSGASFFYAPSTAPMVGTAVFILLGTIFQSADFGSSLKRKKDSENS